MLPFSPKPASKNRALLYSRKVGEQCILEILISTKRWIVTCACVAWKTANAQRRVNVFFMGKCLVVMLTLGVLFSHYHLPLFVKSGISRR